MAERPSYREIISLWRLRHIPSDWVHKNIPIDRQGDALIELFSEFKKLGFGVIEVENENVMRLVRDACSPSKKVKNAKKWDLKIKVAIQRAFKEVYQDAVYTTKDSDIPIPEYIGKEPEENYEDEEYLPSPTQEGFERVSQDFDLSGLDLIESEEPEINDDFLTGLGLK
jgi:hypothetical protein